MSDNSESSARGTVEYIESLLSGIDEARDDGTDRAELIRDEISEMSLSVQIRASWHNPGDTGYPDEFTILLGTGGPAVRITGELNQYCEPVSAQLEHQD